jgi:hypothetical protein
VVYDRYDRYGNGGILHKPRSTGKKGYEKCQAWMRKYDKGNCIILTLRELETE